MGQLVKGYVSLSSSAGQGSYQHRTEQIVLWREWHGVRPWWMDSLSIGTVFKVLHTALTYGKNPLRGSYYGYCLPLSTVCFHFITQNVFKPPLSISISLSRWAELCFSDFFPHRCTVTVSNGTTNLVFLLFLCPRYSRTVCLCVFKCAQKVNAQPTCLGFHLLTASTPACCDASRQGVYPHTRQVWKDSEPCNPGEIHAIHTVHSLLPRLQSDFSKKNPK